MNKWEDIDFLDIAGIQHFSFCRRQWALIHIEKEWEDNDLTVLGSIVHEHAHDGSFTEKRGDILITRSLEVRSYVLKAHGFCDVVEFHKDKQGVKLFNREGTWKPYPVEYKKGKPKTTEMDRLQLCTQAIALEEMFDCNIDKGYLFYHEIAKREEVEFSEALRKQVESAFQEMHAYYEKSYTPKVKPSAKCKRCSLQNICLPEIANKESVNTYIKRKLHEEAEDEKIK